MRTTIEVFSIKIKTKDGYVDFGGNIDYFDLMSDTENGLFHHIDVTSTGDIPTLQRTVKIPSSYTNAEGDLVRFYHSNENERYICGIIETGTYGKEYEIARKNTPNEIEYVVDREHAIIKPFFFFFKIPRRGCEALMILERTDNEGIFPLMHLLLKTFLNDSLGIDNKFNIEKGNIVLNSYMEELTSGRYKSVTLSARQESTDAANRYFGHLESTEYTMELVVKFKNNLGSDRERAIREHINSGNTLFVMPELNTIFDCENKKVESVVGSGRNAKTRTLYLGDDRQGVIRPYYELEVEANERNHSLYSSIKQKTRDFINIHTEFNMFE